MVFLLVAALLFLALLVFALAGGVSSGPYPAQIRYGSVVISFSTVDRLCYPLAVTSVIVGVIAGILLIWGLTGNEVLGRVAATAALVFGGSLLVLLVNRLMRGRREP